MNQKDLTSVLEEWATREGSVSEQEIDRVFLTLGYTDVIKAVAHLIGFHHGYRAGIRDALRPGGGEG